MKKLICLILCIFLSFSLCACKEKTPSGLDAGYDLSLPTLGENGWYEVFTDNFDGDALNPEIWTTSPHNVRWKTQSDKNPEYTSYWCPDCVSVKDGFVEIKSFETNSHKCSQGKCPPVGRFTGGIETRAIASDDSSQNKGDFDKLLFSQAFGYFECRVKLPNAQGLWSAFWLQSSNQRKVGNGGKDGTEIDIYESAFIKNPDKMGHALIWDGYGKDSQIEDYILNTNKNLYDNFHTFAVKWSPQCYVFYIDGTPTFASSAGEVSRVKQFLRLTVEMDAGDGYGPHGQKIGKFTDNSSVFYIDYVKVYQNTEYLKEIVDDSEFSGNLDGAN